MEAVGFAPWGGDLYCLTAAGQLLAMKGSGENREGPVQWLAETGELGLDAPESRYLVRLSLWLLPEADSTVRGFVSYDEGGSWQPAGSLCGVGADDGREHAAVDGVKPELVDLELAERVVGRLGGDDAVVADLREIAHAAQKPIGDTRRPARTGRDLPRRRV